MTLFLCAFRIEHHRYMGERIVRDTEHRLVWADSAAQAREKLSDDFGLGSAPGSDSYRFHEFVAHAAIS